MKNARCESGTRSKFAYFPGFPDDRPPRLIIVSFRVRAT